MSPQRKGETMASKIKSYTTDDAVRLYENAMRDASAAPVGSDEWLDRMSAALQAEEDFEELSDEGDA